MLKFAPPFVPSWGIEPLEELCKKAVLWDETGFKKEAGELAFFLAPYEKFLTLWSSERQFQEERLKKLFSRVKMIEPVAGRFPFAPEILRNFSMESAFSLEGPGTIGAIVSGHVEIRAIGPQAMPLGNAASFGIAGSQLERWIALSAYPEIWMKCDVSMDDACKISVNFVGVELDTPLVFAFYVKAPSCKVGGQLLKPGALTRFQGEGREVLFNHLSIQSSLQHKLQVIPLSGSDGFWNCDFLAAFEVAQMAPQINFSIVAK